MNVLDGNFMKIHAYTLTILHPKRLNGMLCGKPGGVCTGHIPGVTCLACLRILKNPKFRKHYSEK